MCQNKMLIFKTLCPKLSNRAAGGEGMQNTHGNIISLDVLKISVLWNRYIMAVTCLQVYRVCKCNYPACCLLQRVIVIFLSQKLSFLLKLQFNPLCFPLVTTWMCLIIFLHLKKTELVKLSAVQPIYSPVTVKAANISG